MTIEKLSIDTLRKNSIHKFDEIVNLNGEKIEVVNLLNDHSKHIISKLIENIKANEDKPVKLIIEYLEGL